MTLPLATAGVASAIFIERVSPNNLEDWTCPDNVSVTVVTQREDLAVIGPWGGGEKRAGRNSLPGVDLESRSGVAAQQDPTVE